MDCLSITPTRYAIFGQTGPPRRLDCLIPLGSIGMKSLSQEHKDTFSSSGTERRADYFAIANLGSYSGSCTAALW